MSTFALVHGGGHSSAAWDLLIPELVKLGHSAVTVDLPVDDPTATLSTYVDVAAAAFADASEPVTVVAHSVMGATGLALEDRVPVRGIVLLNSAIVFAPEVAPDQPEKMMDLDFMSEMTIDDQMVAYASEAFARQYWYHDLDDELVARAMKQVRGQSITGAVGPGTFPQPRVPTVYISADDDRTMNRQWSEWAARRITGRPIRTIPGSHSTFYSRPAELASLLDSISREFEAERKSE